MSLDPTSAPGLIPLRINDEEVRLALPEDASLLTALRHVLGLKGTRFGCGEGNCGACTVQVEGRAVQSCNTPLWSVKGRSVRTIEAADKDPALASVRDAFLVEQAAQCGYCTNGIMMTVAARLADPGCGRAAIVEALDERHLCRCGAHPRVLRAIDRLLAGRATA
jgi:aerobic-type carbon monoxide dehydrogenase small subunit (CoxS/CutS family)